MKAVIITGGTIDRLFLQKELYNHEYDIIIAVDGGAKILLSLKITPEVLIGDFDSIDEKTMTFYRQSNCKIITYPSEKDMTDTDIAIAYATDKSCENIVIYGGIGSRFDHTLANVFVLEKYKNIARITIKNTNNSIELISSGKEYQYQKSQYTYISLIPLSDRIRNIQTSGLKYELTGEDLTRGDSLGISNEIIGNSARVKFEEGILLVVLSKD